MGPAALHRLSFLLVLLVAPVRAGDSLSFVAGRALAAERGDVLLVLVHGSDWLPLGERVLERVWKDGGFASQVGAGVVLADVDVPQAPGEERRRAEEARNEGWVRTECGLSTYPALLAYAPDGTWLGVRQGRELEPTLEGVRRAALELAAACRTWRRLGEELAAAREAGNAARELELLVDRDALPLRRVPNLLDEVKRLDAEDAHGHLARLSFPGWNALVAQATADAKAGKGEEVERRLLAMLASDAYTEEQRSAIHLALGGAYRRWEGREARAAESFRAAWRAAPESVCGRAGMRLYLRDHGGPSLAFGWTERHVGAAESAWVIEDLPAPVEAGTYRLRLRRTSGGVLDLRRVELQVPGRPAIVGATPANPGVEEGVLEVELVVPDSLDGGAASLAIEVGGEPSRGAIEWGREL